MSEGTFWSARIVLGCAWSISHFSQLDLAAAAGELKVDSVEAHIGGSVDSSTSGVVSMPIQVGGWKVRIRDEM